jgi:molybdate transport system substrate-binding protein
MILFLRTISLFVLLLVSFCLPHSKLYADQLMIAVASNFSTVMYDLLNDFEKSDTDTDKAKVVLITGSSGKLYAQIKQGAPFDILLSADQDKPHRLINEGLAVPNTQFTYAIGSLVLWSANQKLIKANEEVLLKGVFNKIALANSKLAPYGLAAEQVLTKLGLEQTTRVNWVQGENISQTYQFVASGNAGLGFVAKSQVWGKNRLINGSVWLIPAHFYDPIKQDAVLLKKTKNIQLAKKMMSFLQSKAVQDKIEKYGYQPNVEPINYIQGR